MELWPTSSLSRAEPMKSILSESRLIFSEISWRSAPECMSFEPILSDSAVVELLEK